MIVLLLALMAIALPRMDEAMWTDEVKSLFYAGAPPEQGPTTPPESLARIAENLWQAPLYYMTLWVWGRLVGWSVFALRTFSLFAGLIAVAGMYAAGRRIFNRQIGLYAAFTLSLSAFFVNYLHDMRVYALILALLTFALWAYHVALESRSRTALVVLLISLTLLLYSHYFMVFFLAGLGLAHIVLHRKNPRFWLIFLTFVGSVILFLPWLGVFISGVLLSSVDGVRYGNMSVPTAVWRVGQMFANGGYVVLIILLLTSLQGQQHQSQRRTLWMWFLVSFGLALITTRYFRILNEVRYIIYLWPGLALITALGIDALKRIAFLPVIVLVAWTGGFAFSLLDEDFQAIVYPWTTPPFDVLSDMLHARAIEDDALLYIIPAKDDRIALSTLFDHYLHGLPLSSAGVIQDTYATTDAYYASNVLETANGADRVWVAHETAKRHWRVGPVKDETLPGAGYSTCSTVADSNETITLTLFARPPADDPTVQFGQDTTAVQVHELAPLQVIEGERLSFALGWQMPAFQPGYSVGVHIENAQGELIDQADFGIAGSGFSCAQVDFDTATWADTDVHVYLLIYNWETGERLPSDQMDATNRVQLATSP
jgi:hypothetical protein